MTADIRERVAVALAEALARRGIPTQLVANNAVAVLVPDETSTLWPIWVTSESTRWRFGHKRDDYEIIPHDGAVDALADRIAAAAPHGEPDGATRDGAAR